MKNVKKDVRGFTLVELLAVIVVLAIIMLIAVNAVLPRMNSAREQAFAIEANALMEAAQTYVVNESLSTLGALKDCVTVAELRTGGYTELADNYAGKVELIKDGSTYKYKVYLQNGQFMVEGIGVEGDGTESSPYKNVVITETHVESYDSSAWDSSNESCE